jgi:penicillin amidase
VATLTAYRAAGAAIAVVALSSCALLTPLLQRTTLDQRLAAFPRTELPLAGPIVIHWNDHQASFNEAENDDDLAFTLGLVHAHLRLGQMEMKWRISQGLIAEMGGPLATDIDHSLRILDVGWVAPEIDAEVEAAVARAARSIDADASDYSVGPLYPEWTETLGGHLFNVEFAEAAVGAERIEA